MLYWNIKKNTDNNIRTSELLNTEYNNKIINDVITDNNINFYYKNNDDTNNILNINNNRNLMDFKLLNQEKNNNQDINMDQDINMNQNIKMNQDINFNQNIKMNQDIKSINQDTNKEIKSIFNDNIYNNTNIMNNNDLPKGIFYNDLPNMNKNIALPSINNHNFKPNNNFKEDDKKNKDIFNLDNISSDYKKNLYDSVDKNAIYATYINNKFIIKNYRQNTLGYFSIIELIKYIINPYDKSDYFIKKIFNISSFNQDVFYRAKAIIKKYILRREKFYNYENEYIKLYDFKKSPFMSNLQMLIYLNKDILKFEKLFNEHSKEYKEMYPDNYDIIINIISELIYKCLSYTLKVITIVSTKINRTINKNNYDQMIKIKNSLYSYSLQIMTKITEHIYKNFNNIDFEQKKIENLIKENKQLKNVIEEKLNTNINLLTTQNDLLDKNIMRLKNE